MAVFTHPKARCWLCITNPAAWVVEAKAPVPHASTPDETESHYRLCCDDFACLFVSEVWANERDLTLADVRALTRSEAEAVTGDDLPEVA